MKDDNKTIMVRPGVDWMLPVAVMTTALSLFIGFYIGWYRGGSGLERALVMTGYALLVLGAHLLIPLWKGLPGLMRWGGIVIWLICLVGSFGNHVSFFQLSQEHAGDRRVAEANVEVTKPLERSGRDLFTIAQDREKLFIELAKLESRTCVADCPRRHLAMTALRAKLTTLEEEAREVVRANEAADRQLQERMHLRNGLQQDLVTSNLARWMNTSVDKVNTGLAVMVALALEGIACLGWYVVLNARTPISIEMPESEPRNVVATPTSIVVMSTELPSLKPAQSVTLVTELDADSQHFSHGQDGLERKDRLPTAQEKLRSLEVQIRTGEFKPSVKKVREFMNCSQEKARELNAYLKSCVPTSAAKEGMRSHVVT